MANEVLTTAQFENDFDTTLNYLAVNLDSPKAASQLLAAVQNAIDTLAELPKMNPVSRNPILNRYGYREHNVKNYVMVYHVLDGQVILIRFLHQKQDVGAYM